jgi:hypothetical protein
MFLFVLIGLIRALEQLRKKDTSIVREGMGELLAYCNSATGGKDSHTGGNVQGMWLFFFAYAL